MLLFHQIYGPFKPLLQPQLPRCRGEGAVTQKLHDEVISKAKGFISWEHYVQGDVWTDFVLWETEEDANNATTVGKGKEVTEN